MAMYLPRSASARRGIEDGRPELTPGRLPWRFNVEGAWIWKTNSSKLSIADGLRIKGNLNG